MTTMIKLQSFERSPKLSEIKAVYRSRTRADERTTITGPIDVVEYLRAIWNKDTLELTEDFMMLCLNTAHHVIGWVKLSSGGFDRSTVEPRLVFSLALQVGAVGLVFAHNHPTGALDPSPGDREITQKLKAAGALLNICVLDHIILGKDEAFSFSEHGLM
jgi:DNA repair protein RadC